MKLRPILLTLAALVTIAGATGAQQSPVLWEFETGG